IYDLAFRDRLTGLSNREKLSRYVDTRLDHRETGKGFFLVIVHLKQLQEINKTLGYAVGDELLVRVALALRTECESCLGGMADGPGFDAEKHLGTLEGANFIVLLESEHESLVERFCHRVLSVFDHPVAYNDMSIDVGACIGYSHADDKTRRFDDLLKSAQVAVESALDRGLGYLCYSEEMDPYSQKRITLMADLKSAIIHDDLKLYLQPKLSLHDNIVIGFEALLRWEHPRHGFVPPDEFIGLAEKSGVINELTEWVIQRAISYLQFFRERDLHPHISINISAKNLQQPFFAEQLIQSLKRKGVDADSLGLEITETAMMDDPDKAMACLMHLKQQGFYLSLDDFGTGYSSLSHLSRLPLNEIKIDRSFVTGIEKQKSPVIVETTLRMAKSFGLVSVAEGIETEAALRRIRALGCDVAQGYYIARPQAFGDVLTWLASQPGYEVLRGGDLTQLKF
ncbi:MAG: bifunctional diguanylate cyclase/phosphodiesterase, partial [Ketobacteraceae bacterium]|nr:bifunctional diguanylate cyclase/phosphodiesterase [Ketobacteraceae bacterium]